MTTTPEALPPLPEPDNAYEDGRDEYGYATYSHGYSKALVETIQAEAYAAGRASLGAQGEPVLYCNPQSLEKLQAALRFSTTVNCSITCSIRPSEKKSLPLYTAQPSPAPDDEATVADYQEALASVDALVRRMDVALNGEEGAAPQARLCDLVSQVEALAAQPAPAAPAVPAVMEPQPWSESSEQALAERSYCHGWNDCRSAALKMQQEPAEPAATVTSAAVQSDHTKWPLIPLSHCRINQHQALAAPVSDEQIAAAALSAGFRHDPVSGALWANDGYVAVNVTYGLHAFARAMRPAPAQPMSEDQMWSLWNEQGVDDMNQSEAIAFARAVEAHHGITAQAGEAK